MKIEKLKRVQKMNPHFLFKNQCMFTATSFDAIPATGFLCLDVFWLFRSFQSSTRRFVETVACSAFAESVTWFSRISSQKLKRPDHEKVVLVVFLSRCGHQLLCRQSHIKTFWKFEAFGCFYNVFR